MTNSLRKKRYAALACLKKDMQIADEAYREVLRRHGGREINGRVSATTMSVKQMDAVLTELHQKSRTKNDWRKARILKIRTLWNRLFELEIVRNREQKSLLKWARNSHLLQSERLEWATSAELNQMIEALKAWLERECVKEQKRGTL